MVIATVNYEILSNEQILSSFQDKILKKVKNDRRRVANYVKSKLNEDVKL